MLQVVEARDRLKSLHNSVGVSIGAFHGSTKREDIETQACTAVEHVLHERILPLAVPSAGLQPRTRIEHSSHSKVCTYVGKCFVWRLVVPHVLESQVNSLER